MASSDNVRSPIYFLDVLERRPFQKNLSMISWALPTPPINPKWLVHNIVPPFKRASIWPINMKWLLENFPPPINPKWLVQTMSVPQYTFWTCLREYHSTRILTCVCVCVCVKNRLRPMCVWLSQLCVRRWVRFVCAGESDLCAPLSQICVRGWVRSVCVAEFWLCAPLSQICVRRWVPYLGFGQSSHQCLWVLHLIWVNYNNLITTSP